MNHLCELVHVAAGDRRLFFLLQHAARTATAHANELMAATLGISATQFGTLAYLAKHPGSTMTAIAELFDLNKSAVSGMIGRLERAGLIARVADPRDARANHVSLTTAGEQVRTAALPTVRRATAAITAGFTADELEIVLRFLNTVIARCTTTSDEAT